MNEEQFAELLRKAQPEAPQAPGHEWQAIQARTMALGKAAPRWRGWLLAGSGALAMASLALFLMPQIQFPAANPVGARHASPLPTPALSETEELEAYLHESLASLGSVEEASLDEYAF